VVALCPLLKSFVIVIMGNKSSAIGDDAPTGMLA
jgi:hypothetical protein